MFKKPHYILIVIFAIFLFASVLIIGAQASSDGPQPIEPTPVVEKNKPQGHQPRILVEQSLSPVDSGGPDAYGYTWSDTALVSIPYNSGTQVSTFSPNHDEGFAGPFAIGFNFPFYEKTYSNVYISTNGVLTFGNGTSDSNNRPFPFIDQPQAVIAPFWDDLAVGGGFNSGKVYYQQYSATQFVITYVDVAKFVSPGELLTFQIVLNANGIIKFQYYELNGVLDEATVGIEDHDGVVGLTYLNNADMTPLEGQAINFVRPPNPDYRPKALPLSQGAFTKDGKLSLSLSIFNAGSSSDEFDLILQNSNPAWQIQLYDDLGSLITKDTNGNSYVETPVLAPGDEYPIKVKFVAPQGADVGSTAVVDLGVRSKGDSNEIWTVNMRSTVPASFAQAVKDSGDIDLRAISRYGQRELTVFPLYTGSSMGVEALNEPTFMMYWERNGQRLEGLNIITWTNIEQAVVDDFGQDILNATNITNNSTLASSAQNVYDTEPATAMSSDGKVGIVWVRRIDAREGVNTGKSNYNVYMAVINANDTTQFVKQPFRITQNDAWGGFGDFDKPEFSNPRITVTPNNTFFVSWADKRQQSDGSESNIGIAAFNSSGGTLLAAQHYAGLVSDPGTTLYRYPTVYGLADNRILVGYSKYDAVTRIDTPGYAVLNTGGGTVSPPQLLSGVEGQYPVVTQLGNGSIIYAWTKTTSENSVITSSQIAYVIINPATYDASLELVLANPDGLQSDYVSLTSDENSNVIFTWIDTDLEQNLYYALVDSTGTLVTPAMSFYEIEGNETLLLNESGSGNAFYVHRFGVFFPLTIR